MSVSSDSSSLSLSGTMNHNNDNIFISDSIRDSFSDQFNFLPLITQLMAEILASIQNDNDNNNKNNNNNNNNDDKGQNNINHNITIKNNLTQSNIQSLINHISIGSKMLNNLNDNYNISSLELERELTEKKLLLKHKLQIIQQFYTNNNST